MNNNNDASFSPIKNRFKTHVWAEMSSYDKNAFLSQYNNYQHMLKMGYSAIMPNFMQQQQEPLMECPRKDVISKKSTGRTVNKKLKELSTETSYSCDSCPMNFKSKRLCDNHRKLCKPFVGEIGNHLIQRDHESAVSSAGKMQFGIKAKILNSCWREETIQSTASSNSINPLNTALTTSELPSEPLGNGRAAASTSQQLDFNQSMSTGIQGNANRSQLESVDRHPANDSDLCNIQRSSCDSFQLSQSADCSMASSAAVSLIGSQDMIQRFNSPSNSNFFLPRSPSFSQPMSFGIQSNANRSRLESVDRHPANESDQDRNIQRSSCGSFQLSQSSNYPMGSQPMSFGIQSNANRSQLESVDRDPANESDQDRNIQRSSCGSFQLSQSSNYSMGSSAVALNSNRNMDQCFSPFGSQRSSANRRPLASIQIQNGSQDLNQRFNSPFNSNFFLPRSPSSSQPMSFGIQSNANRSQLESVDRHPANESDQDRNIQRSSCGSFQLSQSSNYPMGSQPMSFGIQSNANRSRLESVDRHPANESDQDRNIQRSSCGSFQLSQSSNYPMGSQPMSFGIQSNANRSQLESVDRHPANESDPRNIQVSSCASFQLSQSANHSMGSSAVALNSNQNMNQSFSPHGSHSSSENRRPLASIQIQIREARFRVPDASLNDILPDKKDPNYVQALNTESRINRLMTDATASIKYKYDVKSILQKSPTGLEILDTLNKGELVYGAQRNAVVNALVNHLFQRVSHPALVSTIMRESMAVQVVATWPSLQMKLYTEEDRPWHHWYNADQNTGYLENATQIIQRKGKRPGKGIRKTKSDGKKPRKLAVAAVREGELDSDPEEYIKDVSEAKQLVGLAVHKTAILSVMTRTFDRRRKKIEYQQVDTVRILSEFPHFMHHHGEVIEQEFNLMFEQKQNCFHLKFVNDTIPKLLMLADKEPEKFEGCTSSKYDVINAMMILAKFLPIPIRTFAHEADMPLQANLIDLFHVIPIGSDPVSYTTSQQSESEYKIQPRILATGNSQGVRKMWLVVDGKFLELHTSATPSIAIDLLIKSFFVFHLHFPLSWKNVFRFLQVHIYEIPVQNKRLSIFSEKHLILQNMKH